MLRQIAQILVIYIGHVGETCAEFIQVGADERVFAGEVDMIGNKHQVSGVKACVDSAGSIGENEHFYTDSGHYAHRQCDVFGIIALIAMKAAAHHHDALAKKRAAQ